MLKDFTLSFLMNLDCNYSSTFSNLGTLIGIKVSEEIEICENCKFPRSETVFFQLIYFSNAFYATNLLTRESQLFYLSNTF